MSGWRDGVWQRWRGWSTRLRMLAILLAGLIIPQLILYAPSFFGGKVLLPLDILASTFGVPGVEVQDRLLSDLVVIMEPWRRFSATELAAGRCGLWNPDIFAGVPSSSISNSPFQLLYALWPSPHCLVWVQLVKTVFAGLGAYLFLRRALHVGFWPATLASWCLPLTGFYTVWQGFCLSYAAAYLPWMLLAIHATISHQRWGITGLACLTGLTLISGQLDVALQVLLASGIYAIWLMVKPGGPRRRPLLRSALGTTVGWIAGFMLAAPLLLPWLEYLPTGARIIERAIGTETRPPTGLSALPQLLIPDFYGTTQAGWTYLGTLQLPESASAGFAGLIVTLFLAPLAWVERSRRVESFFWLGLTVFALGWTLNIPGLVTLLRHFPILKMLSHNRLVFVSGFALIVLAALGLEALCKVRAVPGSRIVARRWFALPVITILALLAWCAWRWQVPPPQLLEATQSPQELGRILDNFGGVYQRGMVMSLLGLIGWASVLLGARARVWHVPALLVAMWLEYFSFAAPFNPQTDPALYYPRRSMFTQLRELPGRVLAVSDWPPNTLSMYGLRDIRGYDGVDPKRITEVMRLAEDLPRSRSPYHARTMYYCPLFEFTGEGQIRLRPALNMLNVRWLVFRGGVPPQARPVLQDGPHWVIENVAALPRAFVPRQVLPTPGGDTALPLLAAPDFEPSETAYLDGQTAITDAQGHADVTTEVSDEVTLVATMQTPGMVVLADQWFPGWRAWVDGKEVPIQRVNHVLRGVSVPAGTSTIVYRYEPASFTIGLWLMASAAGMLVAWNAFSRWNTARHAAINATQTAPPA